MKNSLEIAQEATLLPIDEIGAQMDLEPEEIEPYGRYKGKISLAALDRLADRPNGKLVCVTGMTPTNAGEGKTTTSIGLTEGMGYIGRSRASWAIRRDEGVVVCTQKSFRSSDRPRGYD